MSFLSCFLLVFVISGNKCLKCMIHTLFEKFRPNISEAVGIGFAQFGLKPELI